MGGWDGAGGDPQPWRTPQASLDPGFHLTKAFKGLPGGSAVRTACSAGASGGVGSIPGQEDPLEGEGRELTPVSLPGEFLEQRSLVGYSHGVAKMRTPRKQISTHNPSRFSQSSLVIVPKVRSLHCAEGTSQVLDNL